MLGRCALPEIPDVVALSGREVGFLAGRSPPRPGPRVARSDHIIPHGARSVRFTGG